MFGTGELPCKSPLANLVPMTMCRDLFEHLHDSPANNDNPLLRSGPKFYSTMNTTQQVQAKGLCVLATDAAKTASDGMLIVNGTTLQPGDVLWTHHVADDAKLCVPHSCQCRLKLPPPNPPPPVASQAPNKQRGGLKNKTRV